MAYLIKNLPRFLLRLVVATFLVSTFFVLTQDFHVFPGLYSSYLFGFKNEPPADVDALQAVAADGQAVTLWRMRAEGERPSAVVLLFHGNAETISHTVHLQRWLKNKGMTSYAVEYRGYDGRDSGWPSEEGLYEDAIAAFKRLVDDEQIDPHQVVVWGSSIGTGLATYVAQKYDVGTLVLISPFSSLRDVVAETPLLGYLAGFLRYNFPSGDYIKRLARTCVIIAHGTHDSTIPFRHAERMVALHQSPGYLYLIEAEAGHNDVMQHAAENVSELLGKCLNLK